MPQDVNSEKKRIEWVDFFKGILICLVVIGHATGRRLRLWRFSSRR